MSTAKVTFKWACPKCGADANKHGKGGVEKCTDRISGTQQCLGFICECENDTEDSHGTTVDDPCREANCYHCGWGGTFPVMPKGLQAWEKKALEAGWSPPAKRAEELSGRKETK
jgi:hypothetical protein